MPDEPLDWDHVVRGVQLLLAERWQTKWRKKASASLPGMPIRAVTWLMLVAQNPKRRLYADVFGGARVHDIETLFATYPDEAAELWLWARQLSTAGASQTDHALFALMDMPGAKRIEVAAALATRARRGATAKNDQLLNVWDRSVGNAVTLAKKALKKSLKVKGPLF